MVINHVNRRFSRRVETKKRRNEEHEEVRVDFFTLRLCDYPVGKPAVYA